MAPRCPCCVPVLGLFWAVAVLQLTGTWAWGCRQRKLAPTHLTQPLHSPGRRRTGASWGWFAEIPSRKYFLPLIQPQRSPAHSVRQGGQRPLHQQPHCGWWGCDPTAWPLFCSLPWGAVQGACHSEPLVTLCGAASDPTSSSSPTEGRLPALSVMAPRFLAAQTDPCGSPCPGQGAGGCRWLSGEVPVPRLRPAQRGSGSALCSRSSPSPGREHCYEEAINIC